MASASRAAPGPGIGRRGPLGLGRHDYLADEGLATAVFLALRLQRPLLLEGEAGVGKTEVAKVLARWTGGELVRLQCYEGIDVAQARLRVGLRPPAAAPARRRGGRRGRGRRRRARGRAVHRAVPRAPAAAPGHRATAATAPPPVLLIDEVDRADDEFEAFLLEILADYAVTVPELGHVPRRAARRSSSSPRTAPATSTTRSKRRCLYHWVEHPDFEREVAIVRLRAPGGRPSAWPARSPAAVAGRARPRAVQAAGRGRDDRLGRRRWPRSAATELDEAAVSATLGTS